MYINIIKFKMVFAAHCLARYTPLLSKDYYILNSNLGILLFYIAMPRKRLEFHKLSNRSKRRRINEETDSLHKSDSSSTKNCSSSNYNNDYNEENYDFENDNSDCSYESKQSTTCTSKNIIEDTNEIQRKCVSCKEQPNTCHRHDTGTVEVALIYFYCILYSRAG